MPLRFYQRFPIEKDEGSMSTNQDETVGFEVMVGLEMVGSRFLCR